MLSCCVELLIYTPQHIDYISFVVMKEYKFLSEFDSVIAFPNTFNLLLLSACTFFAMCTSRMSFDYVAVSAMICACVANDWFALRLLEFVAFYKPFFRFQLFAANSGYLSKTCASRQDLLTSVEKVEVAYYDTDRR